MSNVYEDHCDRECDPDLRIYQLRHGSSAGRTHHTIDVCTLCKLVDIAAKQQNWQIVRWLVEQHERLEPADAD